MPPIERPSPSPVITQTESSGLAIFTPVAISGKSENPKFKDQKCHGIEVWVTNRDQYKSIDVGVLTLFSIYNMYPSKIKVRESSLNKLWGNGELYKKLLRGATVDDILKF